MGGDIKKAENRLKDISLKLTKQRQIILNLLAENSDKHLNAEEIRSLLLQNNVRTGIATVYRTLSLFEEWELVGKIYLDDGCLRYQLLNPQEKHEHHHLICERCDRIVDIQVDLMDSLEKQVDSYYGFRVTNHHVKLYGVCLECLSK
ncbi:MAG TPA: transcriptional repressor [Candidatus Limnocylindrales bacterium]|nr:transcriptional repressor [Candidatus Limnocylindrales bacterium]